MSLFLIWLGISLTALTVYLIYLWHHGRNRSRFRVKLTLLFLLFVLVPTIPLTFLTADILTEAADILLLPGIGETLNQSLETLQRQTETRGLAFLDANSNPNLWDGSLLEREGMLFLGVFKLREDSVHAIRPMLRSDSPLPENWTPPASWLRAAQQDGRGSRLIDETDRKWIAVYQAGADSTVLITGFYMETFILDAHEDLSQALRVYNTLLLIKESVLKNNLIWGLAAVLMIFLSVLAILLARLLSRGISEPVRDLVQGMERVAGGDLSLTVKSRARDEFRFLVDSFNRMIRDLQTSRERLKQAERMAAWQQVARQISHEIKNSLTPISLSLRRLRGQLDKKTLSGPIAESIEAIDGEIHALESMAAEFSQFARMPRPVKQTLDLNTLIHSVVLLLEPAIGRGRVETRLHPDLDSVQADRDQIKRLLINLIKNAAEASPPETPITVFTRPNLKDPARTDLEIQDLGSGMDPSQLEHVYHPYYTTKEKGTGLGLTLVKKIVDEHHGTIHIQSRKGEGTRIIVTL